MSLVTIIYCHSIYAIGLLFIERFIPASPISIAIIILQQEQLIKILLSYQHFKCMLYYYKKYLY